MTACRGFVLLFALVALSDGRALSSTATLEAADSAEAAAAQALVSQLLQGKGPSQRKLMEAGTRHVDLKATAKRLEGKLPAEMVSLVSKGKADPATGVVAPTFDEASLAKALSVLNKLIEAGWKELDEKLVECKTFEEKNRGTYDQVMTDITRIAETIADLERARGIAQQCINDKEVEIIQVREAMKVEYQSYMTKYLENSREMKIRKNDLAVFQFMMQITKCKTSLVQLHGGARICESHDGFLQLGLGDEEAQKKLQRMMTPSARRLLHDILGTVQAVQAGRGTSLLQESPEITAPNKTEATQTAPVQKVEVVTEVSPAAGKFKCNKGPPDCGLLHDKMSLLWGKYKDLVDELQQEMDKNLFDYKDMMFNYNEQLTILRNAKTTCIAEMNQAIADLNANREELFEKQTQSRELESDYHTYVAACKARIEYILYQDICSYITVRATIMAFSTVSPPDKIVDCDVSQWVPSECTVSCDDSCDKDPFGCGGKQYLNREVIIQPNQYGYTCPALSWKKPCNQVLCPIDCELSQWTSWGKCSKACEGGAQGHTRDILEIPKNGGMACNTVQESRPCNTGSCDRNCRLRRWSKWSPCSVACDGGFQERWRRISRPIRGNGRCPKDTSRYRHRQRKCNTFECNGDEICIAKQDLVIAIDGSGSVQDSGFTVIKDFASELIGKYQGQYFGFEDMQVGVVQFGNGEILPDGTIAGAQEIIALTSDMAAVSTAVGAMTWQKGFTNMAQAFTLAEKLFILGGRRNAQEAVLTVTDGKPSFLFQTHEKVMQLKDKHTKLYFAPITEFAGDELDLMKTWASDPWQTSLVHIPGLAPLQADPGVFAQRCLVKFCPEAMSPSAMMFEEEEVGYMLIRENGACGKRDKKKLSGSAQAADCAALAQGAGCQAFSLGAASYVRGRCYCNREVVIDAAVWKGFETNRVNPTCPGGEFKADALYDFYAIEPLSTA